MGDVIHSFTFPHFLRYKMQASIKCLVEVVLALIEWVTTRRTYVWQEDSAPYHINRKSQSLLPENICEHITPNTLPINSLDCNLFDYYLWSTLERETNKTYGYTNDELKSRMTTAFTNLNKRLSERLAEDSEVIWRL